LLEQVPIQIQIIDGILKMYNEEVKHRMRKDWGEVDWTLMSLWSGLLT